MLKGLLEVITDKMVHDKLCSSCTRRLDKQKLRESITTEKEIVKCMCGRLYIYDRPHRRYSVYRDHQTSRIVQ